METRWLEDFVSLAETGSFSKSAALRHVTQPAFSRRIKALEAWVGTDLIDRTSYPTKLTPAGKVFFEQALEMLGRVTELQHLLRGPRRPEAEIIDFALPHTLALTYFPGWLSRIARQFRPLKSRLRAENVHDAVLRLVEGGCDVVICYHHAEQPVQLDPARYETRVLGDEGLFPYARAGRDGVPEFVLPGRANQPIPFLAYSPNAYLSRMVDLALATSRGRVHLEKVFETDMAESLKAMALEGHGLAFLPDSAVVTELKRKRLARAGERWGVTMEIRAYREAPSPARPAKPIVQALWEHLSR
ncbi:MAG TPA: LysR substrate-binding domain-containing protein [Burkholderiaceae bacterium]|nr:LysR substrate-binding domain-containing protein [Burkholderiaceae bacterium]